MSKCAVPLPSSISCRLQSESAISCAPRVQAYERHTLDAARPHHLDDLLHPRLELLERFLAQRLQRPPRRPSVPMVRRQEGLGAGDARASEDGVGAGDDVLDRLGGAEVRRGAGRDGLDAEVEATFDGPRGDVGEAGDGARGPGEEAGLCAAVRDAKASSGEPGARGGSRSSRLCGR